MYFSNFYELNEMSTVSRGFSMTISVNPDKNRIGDEYFKIYNSESVTKANKIIRILFRKPEYVFHTSKGYSDWILTKNELKNLLNFLNSTEILYDNNGVGHTVTIYQKAIILYNYERGLGNNISDALTLMLNNTYADYMPLNLEMPDYMLLE